MPEKSKAVEPAERTPATRASRVAGSEAMEADRPAEPSSRRAQRWTFVAIGLLAVPIFVAMLYGVFGRGGDDRPPVRSGAPSVLEDDDRKGSAVGPAIAITALGGIVAVCIAVPLVRAHRRRSTAVGSSAESA